MPSRLPSGEGKTQTWYMSGRSRSSSRRTQRRGRTISWKKAKPLPFKPKKKPGRGEKPKRRRRTAKVYLQEVPRRRKRKRESRGRRTEKRGETQVLPWRMGGKNKCPEDSSGLVLWDWAGPQSQSSKEAGKEGEEGAEEESGFDELYTLIQFGYQQRDGHRDAAGGQKQNAPNCHFGAGAFGSPKCGTDETVPHPDCWNWVGTGRGVAPPDLLPFLQDLHVLTPLGARGPGVPDPGMDWRPSTSTPVRGAGHHPPAHEVHRDDRLGNCLEHSPEARAGSPGGLRRSAPDKNISWEAKLDCQRQPCWRREREVQREREELKKAKESRRRPRGRRILKGGWAQGGQEIWGPQENTKQKRWGCRREDEREGEGVSRGVEEQKGPKGQEKSQKSEEREKWRSRRISKDQRLQAKKKEGCQRMLRKEKLPCGASWQSDDHQEEIKRWTTSTSERPQTWDDFWCGETKRRSRSIKCFRWDRLPLVLALVNVQVWHRVRCLGVGQVCPEKTCCWWRETSWCGLWGYLTLVYTG